MLTPKKIAVIDPFLMTPAIPCFNRLVSELAVPMQYHQPHFDGIKTVEATPADAYIVLGSASHVFQNLEWHAPLARLLVSELERGKPVLGICFGHQLMCHTFGGKVEFFKADEEKQVGPRTVEITQDVFGLKKGTPLHLAVSHRQVVTTLPDCLEEIGFGLKHDVVRHKTLPFMGTQPHPEASLSFCNTEAYLGKTAELEAVQRDGMRLIKAFFHHHGFIASINP